VRKEGLLTFLWVDVRPDTTSDLGEWPARNHPGLVHPPPGTFADRSRWGMALGSDPSGHPTRRGGLLRLLPAGAGSLSGILSSGDAWRSSVVDSRPRRGGCSSSSEVFDAHPPYRGGRI